MESCSEMDEIQQDESFTVSWNELIVNTKMKHR